MKPITIAFDCDGILVDSITPWFDWANKRLPKGAPTITPECLGDSCDWVPLMQERGVQKPFQYWLMQDLYDEMKPMAGVLEFIKHLRNYAMNTYGVKLNFIVVSKCVPEHLKSKKDFIDREFQGLFDGFIDTGDKQYVDFDLLIDDTLEMCTKVAQYGKNVLNLPHRKEQFITGLEFSRAYANFSTLEPTDGKTAFEVLNQFQKTVVPVIIDKLIIG